MTVTDVDQLYNRYDDGQMVRFSADFKDVAQVLTDPSAIEFRYKDPSTKTVVVKKWPTPADITKDAVGQFHIDVDTTNFNEGTWYYKWLGTGAVVAAQRWAFVVNHEELPP